MDWIQSMQKAVNYIEENILDDLNIDKIAESVYSSSANFQRIFSVVTGMTIGDYVRYRRLTLAGKELCVSKENVVNIGLKYGYETAESFTKAFTRFHGVTPSSAKKSGDKLKYFAPLSIQVDIRGGFNMQRKLIPNIPEVDYYGNEVDYIFNLLTAIFKGAGEKIDRAEIAVYRGMANRFVWIDGEWNRSRGCEALPSIDQTPFETKIRLLKTFGWDARYINILRDGDGKPLNTDNGQIRRDFVESIDKGYPVMTLSKKNPRHIVVIGYENDGSIIVSKEGIDGTKEEHFSDTVVRESWEDTIREYILLKDKSDPVPERERFLDLLKLLVARARRTEEIVTDRTRRMGIKGYKVGFAAWEAYLRMLEHDDYSALALEASDGDSVKQRMGVYCDGLCQIYAREQGLPYYQSLAGRFPEWREELTVAVAALDICQKYAGFWHESRLRFNKESYEKFRAPEMRKILADEGRRAMQKDIEAVEQFEKILHKEGL